MADSDCERLLNEDDEMPLSRTDDNHMRCCVRCIRTFAWCCLEIVFYNRCVRCVVNLWKKYEPKTNRNYGRNGNVEMPCNRHNCYNMGNCFLCIRNIACCCLKIVFYNCCIRCVTNLWKKYDPKTNRSDWNDGRHKLAPFRCDWRIVLKSMKLIACPFVWCFSVFSIFRKKRNSEKSQDSSDEVILSIEDESRPVDTQKQLEDEKEKNARLCSLIESMDFDLKKSNERCNEQKEQLQEEQKKTNDFKSRLEQISKQLEVEKTEKEKALTRLSAVAGDKLRLNNPGIADLSDENRPNKLAEKFSELYDNEWTELYDELESGGKAEPDIVKEMLNLLQNIYQHASDLAEKQRRKLVAIISKPSTTELDQFDNSSDQILSKVIELQKQTVSMSIGNLKQIIAVKVDAQDMSEVKKKYYDRCVQLCWIMAIQDPPMMLDFGKGKGTPVNTDVFRMFTKQGTITDFVVWPAIYLHDNGPLVQKGVLQPE